MFSRLVINNEDFRIVVITTAQTYLERAPNY